jgi:hypothetical protein
MGQPGFMERKADSSPESLSILAACDEGSSRAYIRSENGVTSNINVMNIKIILNEVLRDVA